MADAQGGNMNILHYSLGLPPYRTGGLTKYSFDLMREQVRNDDNVYLLFPGEISFINKKTKIKYYKNECGINTYEIVNPLPVPLLNGISEPNKFMKNCNKEIFRRFLTGNDIQVVHIHTFMGLHKEFLEACNDLRIKKVYTTHDYFGICTKVNFIDNEGELCEERELERCLRCNKSGYSMKSIMILQSPMYRFLKEKGIISKLKPLIRKIKKNSSVNYVQSNIELIINTKHKNEYNKLLDYYNDMFSYVDSFLFNSTISKKVYNQYIHSYGEIVPITHGDIRDNRKIKEYDTDKLKLTYLGPDKRYKGFDLLMNAMNELNKKYKLDIELNLYGDISRFETDDNIKIHGRYSYEQLNEIFDNTDLLVVPSMWNETFGFIVLEALSYGVPVLMTNKVGSKDLIDKNKCAKGVIVTAEENSFKDEIKNIYNTRSILNKFNYNIRTDKFNYELNEHCDNIKKIYIKALN